MKSFVRNLSFAAALAIVLALLPSCQNPLTPSEPKNTDGDGTLVIQISPLASLSLLPDIDMKPASYTVSGVGPVVIPSLKYGDWTVTVEALNAAGTLIGSDQQTATIVTGQNTALNMTVRPLNGYGTLNLTVNWNTSAVASPGIKAQLVTAAGTTLTLSFSSTAGGSASYSNSSVPTGYHTLVLQLEDGGVLVAGAVEIVRIVKGQVTSGSFDFQQANGVGGQITVNVTPDLDSPIDVAMSGQLAQLSQGTNMTVTASVPAGTGTVVYAWYLNGASKSVGQSYALGSSLPAGYYRLDVTAFSSNGKKAGSASHTFQVAAAQLTQAVLEWDPNTETDLAGYKIYWGTASGSYPSSVDVGRKTSYTLTGLQGGKTYYITATAYNTGGLESGHSNEVVFGGS
jgi:hypothetical protein